MVLQFNIIYGVQKITVRGRNHLSSGEPEDCRSFKINSKIIYAMRRIGLGLAGMKTFLMLMDLPSPINHSAYDKLNKKIHNAVKDVAHELMNEASEEIRVLGGGVHIVDTSVSCDGTWQKRGLTSLNGAVACLSINTGKGINVDVMSHYCQACVTSAPLEKSDPDKFETFRAHHKPDCRINHMGSAPAIFKRRMEKKGLRYVNFYGDGDPKSLSSVENIYSGIKVTKYECIGHVQKRMGNRLRKMRKTVKGLGGTGRLNDKMIDKFQNYYGISIRRNTGNSVEKMKKAIWGGFFHVCSSEKRPYHDHCDVSWCKYVSDIKNKTKTYVPGPGLPEDVIKVVKPILSELTNDNLLGKCLHGKTQNQKESLNAMFWNRVPKGTYLGLRQLEIGIYDAVSHFNIGNKAVILVYDKLGMVVGNNMRKGCFVDNTFRIENPRRKCSEDKKTRRRYIRRVKKQKIDKITIVERRMVLVLFDVFILKKNVFIVLVIIN